MRPRRQFMRLHTRVRWWLVEPGSSQSMHAITSRLNSPELFTVLEPVGEEDDGDAPASFALLFFLTSTLSGSVFSMIGSECSHRFWNTNTRLPLLPAAVPLEPLEPLVNLCSPDDGGEEWSAAAAGEEDGCGVVAAGNACVSPGDDDDGADVCAAEALVEAVLMVAIAEAELLGGEDDGATELLMMTDSLDFPPVLVAGLIMHRKSL